MHPSLVNELSPYHVLWVSTRAEEHLTNDSRMIMREDNAIECMHSKHASNCGHMTSRGGCFVSVGVENGGVHHRPLPRQNPYTSSLDLVPFIPTIPS